MCKIRDSLFVFIAANLYGMLRYLMRVLYFQQNSSPLNRPSNSSSVFLLMHSYLFEQSFELESIRNFYSKNCLVCVIARLFQRLSKASCFRMSERKPSIARNTTADFDAKSIVEFFF